MQAYDIIKWLAFFSRGKVGSGEVTLDQVRAVVHTPNSGPDQETSLALANLVTLTATIHDSLVLKVLMLVYPVAAVKRWQAGG